MQAAHVGNTRTAAAGSAVQAPAAAAPAEAVRLPVVYGNGTPTAAPVAGSGSAASQRARTGDAATAAAPKPGEPGAGAAPQAPSSSEPERVRRSAVLLAACLACDLCGKMLDDPVTVPECMHSFCRACIDAALPEAGRSAGAQCPACAEAGEAVMLGARPYADRRLQPDVVLAELARKLFPASDPRREEAFRIARARRAEFDSGPLGNIARVRLQPKPPPQQMPLGQAVPLFVCPAADPAGPGAVARPAAEPGDLERPYLRVPPSMHAAALGRYVAEQLGLPPAEAVELACGGERVAGAATLGETLEGLRARGGGGGGGLVEYGVGGSGAESLMLVIHFRVVLAATAPADARGTAGASLAATGADDAAAAAGSSRGHSAQDASDDDGPVGAASGPALGHGDPLNGEAPNAGPVGDMHSSAHTS